MPKWEEPTTVKIHEGCGGRIRWVEAIDRPGVGWTGQCRGCAREGIPAEEMLPIVAIGDSGGFKGEFDFYEELIARSSDSLAGLEWDERAEWDENQSRLRAVFLGDEA